VRATLISLVVLRLDRAITSSHPHIPNLVVIPIAPAQPSYNLSHHCLRLLNLNYPTLFSSTTLLFLLHATLQPHRSSFVPPNLVVACLDHYLTDGRLYTDMVLLISFSEL
jgi:hypothetical protein